MSRQFGAEHSSEGVRDMSDDISVSRNAVNDGHCALVDQSKVGQSLEVEVLENLLHRLKGKSVQLAEGLGQSSVIGTGSST